MAWTNPRTWGVGETVTAAKMNEISADLNAVGDAPPAYTPTVIGGWTVRDFGPGIPVHQRNRVIRRFWRADRREGLADQRQPLQRDGVERNDDAGAGHRDGADLGAWPSSRASSRLTMVASSSRTRPRAARWSA